MKRDFHRRYATALLLTALACLPAVIWGSINAYRNTDNSINQWLPQNCAATEGYYRFRQLFGSDETILVSWVGCTLEDGRLEQFAQAMEGKGSCPEVLPILHLIEHVTTGQRAIDQLRMQSMRISRNQAIRRLQGVLVGPDGRTTCAAVTLVSDTSSQRAAVVTAIRRITVKYCGIAAKDLRLSGDAVISVGIDTEGAQAVDHLIWPSALLALTIAWVCLRSLKFAVLVFLLSQFCQGITETMIYTTGGNMNLLVVLVPALVYVLSLSASVHLVNYYREAVRSYGPIRAPRKALQAGWQPCFIAAVTTALGLASLCVSHVVPVQNFGIYASAGVLISFGVLVLLIPAATVKFPVGSRAQGQAGAVEAKPKHQPIYETIVETLIRRPRSVVALFVMAFATLMVGLTKIQTSVEPVRFLPPASRWITDMHWYRQQIGPLTSTQIVLGFQDNCGIKFADRMRIVRNLQIRVGQLDRVEGTASAATFAPKLGPLRRGPASLGRLIRGNLTDRAILQHRAEFIEGRFLAQDGDWEMWRIEARITSFIDLDYDQFLQTLEAETQSVLEAADVLPGTVQVDFTGGVPLVFAAQHELLNALFVSFALALGLVTIVMALVLRSPLAGLLAMFPNIFPALATFGLMGWTGTMVDVGSMMTASIGLGIAVDDTLHFITWFRRACRDGADRKEAIRTAYHRCGPAMLHTTLIAGLGLFVFFFSSFQPVSQFGLLMLLLLVTALVGDLLLLPALLATRLGAFFHRGI